MSSESKASDGNLLYILGLPGGGLLLGFGVLLLYYSFGYEGGNMADHLNELGASGVDQLALLDAADYSIGMVVAGAVFMIFLNAGAWKHTGGY